MPTFLNVTRMPRVQDCGDPTVIGCERVNSLFASQLISFVSRPHTSQIVFQNRTRLLVTETFFDAFLSASRQYSRLIYPKAPINSSAELAIFSNLDQGSIYRRCLETSLVISNILTWLLPLNTGLSESSALIMVRFFLSWQPCLLM
jgi:hypothetical protein